VEAKLGRPFSVLVGVFQQFPDDWQRAVALVESYPRAPDLSAMRGFLSGRRDARPPW
jgi:hypothetical protein